MLLRFKIALLATFVLLTLLGMAAPSMKALIIGVSALALSLLISLIHFVTTEEKAERETRAQA